MNSVATHRSSGRWSCEQYQLIDFGEGRKLERFGPLILDRDCPAAEGVQVKNKHAWQAADIVLDPKGKVLKPVGDLPEFASSWSVQFGELRFLLKLTPFGHVGLFPEQAANWEWLSEVAASFRDGEHEPTALNLFAYTGGTSMALAAAGMHVVHVDASAPAVAWARENATASGLESAPIRWIVEDARKFVARELKRGRAYDVIVLDPPTFGHGPRGQRWEIAKHLGELLDACVSLLRGVPGNALLLTAHSTRPSQSELYGEVTRRFSGTDLSGEIRQGELVLGDVEGRELNAGHFIRAIAC